MPPYENDAKMRILMAAKKLFAKQGFDATSVRQICEEAGANIALVMSPRIEQLQEMVFPIWCKFRELLQQGREQGVFAFESLDSMMLFSIGSILIQKHRDYWQPLIEGPEPGIEEIIGQTIEYILNAINYKGGGPKS